MMTFLHTLATPQGVLEITPARADDLDTVLALFDGGVAWLAAKGMAGQSGITPFSALPAMREHILKWIRSGALFIARERGTPVGTLALSETTPGYARNTWEGPPHSFLYLEAFTTARSRSGQGIGRALLLWAEDYAARQGKAQLLLDCWAENAPLGVYYRQAGFAPCREFLRGDWRGRLFEKRPSPGEISEGKRPR
jgi:GNAT superfamily N-acetyltransferase